MTAYASIYPEQTFESMRLSEEWHAQQVQLHLRKTAWDDQDFLAEQQANPVSTHTGKTERSG